MLTAKEKKVLLMKKIIRRCDTLSSFLAVLSAGLSYYEVIINNFFNELILFFLKE